MTTRRQRTTYIGNTLGTTVTGGGLRGDPIRLTLGGTNFGGGPEPPSGGPDIPGNIGDVEIPGLGGITLGDIAGGYDYVRSLLGGGGNGGGGVQECPGLMSVYVPGAGCVDLSALPPGGRPALKGAIQTNGAGLEEYGPAVKGLYGVGLQPRSEVQTVNRCPPGYALGTDEVCYEGLARNSPRRKWPMGQKPLLTPGDRAAIRKAKSAARKLAGSKRSLKKAARALEKVC